MAQQWIYIPQAEGLNGIKRKQAVRWLSIAEDVNRNLKIPSSLAVHSYCAVGIIGGVLNVLWSCHARLFVAHGRHHLLHNHCSREIKKTKNMKHNVETNPALKQMGSQEKIGKYVGPHEHQTF